MTDEQIVKALAERVMGWEFLRVGYFGVHDGGACAENPRQVELHDWLDRVELENVGDYFVDVPKDFWIYVSEWNPLANDADACAVLDKMVDGGWDYAISAWADVTRCTIMHTAEAPHGHYGNHDATSNNSEGRRRAIAIAALKAVGAYQE